MEKGIIFRISRPYKVYRTAMAPKIVVPGVKGNLTVLVDRAPTLVQLRNGLVQVLDKADKVTERYFIKGGIADIARNRCAISTEKVVAYENTDVEKATAKRDAAIYDEDKAYYQMIIGCLTTFGNKEK